MASNPLSTNPLFRERDVAFFLQKLNSLHEGTTGIQGMDLLGRKVVAGGGAALVALREEIEVTTARARVAGVEARWIDAVLSGLADVEPLTSHLASKGLAGDVPAMMLHSADYLELFSILVVAWQHLASGAAARSLPHDRDAARAYDDAFRRGKLLAMEYWLATELPRLHSLCELCRSGEDSYARIRPDEL